MDWFDSMVETVNLNETYGGSGTVTCASNSIGNGSFTVTTSPATATSYSLASALKS